MPVLVRQKQAAAEAPSGRFEAEIDGVPVRAAGGPRTGYVGTVPSLPAVSVTGATLAEVSVKLAVEVLRGKVAVRPAAPPLWH